MNREKNLIIKDLLEMNEQLIKYVENLHKYCLNELDFSDEVINRFNLDLQYWDANGSIDNPKWIMEAFLEKKFKKGSE